jgi:hypothetical protein
MTYLVNTNGEAFESELPDVFVTLSFLNPAERTTQTEVVRLTEVHESDEDKGPHVFIGREGAGNGPRVKITVEYLDTDTTEETE